MSPRLAELVAAAIADGLDAAGARELSELLAADPQAQAEAVRQYRLGLLLAGLRARPAAEVAAMVCDGRAHPSRALRAIATAEARAAWRWRWRLALAAACLVGVIAGVWSAVGMGGHAAPPPARELVAGAVAPLVLPLAGGEIELAPRSRAVLASVGGAAGAELLAGSLRARRVAASAADPLVLRVDGLELAMRSGELAMHRGPNGVRVGMLAGSAELTGAVASRRLATGAAVRLRADRSLVDDPVQPWLAAAGWCDFPGSAPLRRVGAGDATVLAYDGAAPSGFAQAVHPLRLAGSGGVALRVRVGPHAPEATWNLQLVTADGSCWWLADAPLAGLGSEWRTIDLAPPSPPRAAWSQPGAVFDPAEVTGLIISLCGAPGELAVAAPQSVDAP